MPRVQPRLLVVCGYEPNPITVRKIDALQATGRWDVHLAYWRTSRERDRYPFATGVPPGSVHPVDMPSIDEGIFGETTWLRGLRGSLDLVRFHARLRRVIRHVRPALIHASNSNMLVGCWAACVAAPARALVYDLLDTDDGMRWWPFLPVQRLLHRRVDRLMVPSERFVSGFLHPLGLLPDHLEPVFVANAPWRRTFEDLPPVGGDAFVVGYIGSLRCAPAIAWLIESAARARAAGATIELRFAGTGGARGLVERAATEHAFVTYTGPYAFDADVRGLYARLDAVYAVYDDTADKRTHLACRLSDAIASGRAIIVAADTYMAEIVGVHHLGYVVRAGDPETLVTALRDGWQRRDAWRAKGRIPPALVEQHCFETYVPRLEALYDEAIARRRGPDHA